MATRPVLTRAMSVEMSTTVHTNARGEEERGLTVLRRSVRPLIKDCDTTLLHAHWEEGLIHNVKRTCPLTRGVNKEPVFCKNLNAVLEYPALIDHFTTTYIRNISSLDFTESAVRMDCLRGAVAHNYLVLFPLTHAESDPPDQFQLPSAPVFYSVKEAQILLAKRPIPSACVFDETIRGLIRTYMSYEDTDRVRDDRLVEAIHKQRETLRLTTRTDHSCHGPDLSNLNLSGLEIRNLNIERRTLVNTDFSNCRVIADCCFENTRFIGCNFENSNIQGCNFGGHYQSFYYSSMQNTGFANTNRHFYLPDNNGGLNKTVEELEGYRNKLESLGALNTASLRAFVPEGGQAPIASPPGAFNAAGLVARVFSIQAEASGQAGPASGEAEENPFAASIRRTSQDRLPDDDEDNGPNSPTDPTASPTKKPKVAIRVTTTEG